jgi:hypothetical protein
MACEGWAANNPAAAVTAIAVTLARMFILTPRANRQNIRLASTPGWRSLASDRDSSIRSLISINQQR